MTARTSGSMICCFIIGVHLACGLLWQTTIIKPLVALEKEQQPLKTDILIKNRGALEGETPESHQVLQSRQPTQRKNELPKIRH